MTETKPAELALATPPEAEDFEFKSRFAKELPDEAALIQTILSMANTSGGCILLEQEKSAVMAFDSVRLEGLVDRYIEPRVEGITCQELRTGGVEITVPESRQKPLLLRGDPSSADGDRRQLPTCCAGQVWVRHGSNNVPATAADLERMIRERAAQYLADLSPWIPEPDLMLRACASNGPPAIPLGTEIERYYPYTTRTLGAALGRGQNWAVAAVKCLDLKGRPEFWWGLRGARGRFAVQRYSENALTVIREKLGQQVAWSPLRELRQKRCA